MSLSRRLSLVVCCMRSSVFPRPVYPVYTLPVVFYKRTLLRMHLYRVWEDYLRRSRERIQLLFNEGYRNSAPVAVPGYRKSE